MEPVLNGVRVPTANEKKKLMPREGLKHRNVNIGIEWNAEILELVLW